jgi:chemotaxis methyl-accepting protein methylase
MSVSPSLPLRFRHVVFSGELRRRKAAINLGASHDGVPSVPETKQNLSQENAAFVQWLFRQANLNAGHYRPETLQRRLPACLRALRARSVSHARQVLEAEPLLIASAINAMIIGVTSFFRDHNVFDYLQHKALPELALTRSGLAVWSAGCSEGAEVYSLAILLAEMGLLSTSYVLGTDCRTDALERARLGVFDGLSLKHVPAEWLRRYFCSHGAGWQVKPELRHAVRWRTGDILQAQEPGAWDIILFRNTAMYFRAEAAAPLWERFETALRPGGWLVLGRSERPVGLKRLSLIGPCLYRRNRG